MANVGKVCFSCRLWVVDWCLLPITPWRAPRTLSGNKIASFFQPEKCSRQTQTENSKLTCKGKGAARLRSCHYTANCVTKNPRRQPHTERLREEKKEEANFCSSSRTTRADGVFVCTQDDCRGGTQIHNQQIQALRQVRRLAGVLFEGRGLAQVSLHVHHKPEEERGTRARHMHCILKGWCKDN